MFLRRNIDAQGRFERPGVRADEDLVVREPSVWLDLV